MFGEYFGWHEVVDIELLPYRKHSRRCNRFMIRTINAILVDDEPGCIDNLQHYLRKFCPDIRVIGTAMDTDTAVALINTLPVQLAFLDVQLFDRTSFEILPKAVRQDFSVVFVTAYEQYALNAFRVSALDYILKPLESEEIIRCYGKIVRHFNSEHQEQAGLSGKSTKIMLRQGDHVYLTTVDHIVFLMAQGFYTTVGFEYDGKLREIMLSKPINVVHQEWDTPDLMRVHRSYVINLRRVQAVRKSGLNLSLQIADRIIPVAKRRTAEFFEKYHA